jgi:hypothetical protein
VNLTMHLHLVSRPVATVQNIEVISAKVTHPYLSYKFSQNDDDGSFISLLHIYSGSVSIYLVVDRPNSMNIDVHLDIHSPTTLPKCFAKRYICWFRIGSISGASCWWSGVRFPASNTDACK